MVIFMTDKGEYIPELVEFRITVDKDRASEFAPAMAELALEYGATIISSDAEQPNFRKYMATEMYEEFPRKIVSVITKDDLYRFARDHRVDSTVASRTFNIIRAELSQQRHLKNIKKDDYYVRGPLVNQPTEGKGRRPLEEDGLRVDTLAELVTQLANSPERISGYGQRSQYLMAKLVEQLFKPAEE
jgi:hypothetical protein